ncbi:SusD/RagB family nutrient-binding outer membrane lipoprotein [Pedobacter cryoconitis]|uniref:SusD-like starch-binding protein associating with outer membrane n=1 Tax=Pedobacter cryoconitis TaxID=188932 RepID=A0A327SLP1_9SPHI|nr:SusD/RagB family nutrient-binding outer membrane lipoprotein [Pedobacter cryoconitis]RAJ30196.1 SusD-like starch-binding protein associating with outer membrane [Pedobacter cryoconitis]
MKRIYIILVAAAFFSSCAKNKSDYNIDQKNATDVPAPTLFTAAEKNIADILTTPSVNSNVFRFYVQYWTATDYLDEPRYNLTARSIPQSFWVTMYRDVIANLRESKRLIAADKLIDADVAVNQTAQAEILEIMAWSSLVNTFGNVPYTEAMDIGNVQPKYDDAATVYADLLVRLDEALGKLKVSAAGYGNADLMYNGDAAKWVKFGNSLKLRLGLILADKDPAKAKTAIELAAANVLSSAADNARFPYVGSPPNNNPIATAANPALTSRKDYVGTQSFINKLNALEDPRRAGFFTNKDGQYIGGYYGFFNSYSNYSTMSARVSALNFEALLMDYPETEFALAEAGARGFAVPGTPQEHYNKAVTASIEYWGGTAAEAATYLARPDVAYSTASADFKETIGTQKWIALYNRGYESWTEWRRLDFPKLDPPSSANAPEGQSAPSGLTIPVRLIYPINEQTLNGANRAAAAAAIGGDLAVTKLFWDVK